MVLVILLFCFVKYFFFCSLVMEVCGICGFLVVFLVGSLFYFGVLIIDYDNLCFKGRVKFKFFLFLKIIEELFELNIYD